MWPGAFDAMAKNVNTIRRLVPRQEVTGTADDDVGTDPALVGLALYGFASGVVTAVVALDYLANVRVYTGSYLAGAPPFIALNIMAMLRFLRGVHRWELRWFTFLLPAVAHVLISWLFFGTSGTLRTGVMSTLVFLGIALVWLSWRTGPGG